jgi:transcriptional regulator with XRE-family HTH domain
LELLVAPQSFGDLLRAHRLAAGLTQEAVAERAGLSVHAIQKLERGVTHPYRDTALRLVAALRLSGQDEAEFKELGQPAARHRRHGGPEHVFEFPIARPDLPVSLTSFVGRERDVVDVCKLLDEARLLTLTGCRRMWQDAAGGGGSASGVIRSICRWGVAGRAGSV